jgi:hypothetical protein
MRAFERCRRTIPRALTALAGGNGALGLLDVCRPVFLLPGKLKVPVAFLAGVGTVFPGGDFVVLSHAISLQAGSGTGRYAARRRQCNHPQGARKRGSAGCHMTRPDRSRAGVVPVRIRATPASCGSAMGATSTPELPRGDRPVRFARKGGARSRHRGARSDEPRRSGPTPDGRRFARAERKRRLALPLPWSIQSRSPALADIIGARRVRTALTISSAAIAWE